jgi:hypothetical protein
MMRHYQPPRVETMQARHGQALWLSASHVLSPMSHELVEGLREKEDFHPDDLLCVPGVCLKAVMQGHQGWKYYGRLLKFKGEALHLGEETLDSEVVVLSTDQETLWLGTVEQYEQMWCVD